MTYGKVDKEVDGRRLHVRRSGDRGTERFLATSGELLRRRDIRAVPVVEDSKLIGIVTDRDVRRWRRHIRCFAMKTDPPLHRESHGHGGDDRRPDDGGRR